MQTTSPLLIGRENDLDSLRTAVRESRTGSTRTVVVSGEAGIGKTRLVAEFLDHVPSDSIVLRGQCIDLDRDAPPYAPIVAPLRALVAELGEAAILEATGSAASLSRHALAILLPELGETDVPESQRRGGPDRLYDAVATVLENVARTRPLVLVIEDLHWADQATLGLLRFLLRVVEESRILFVLTFRSDELGRGHPLRAWLPELDRNRRVSRLELPRLNRRQVRQLSTALLGTPLDAYDLGVVFQRTDGVPFFIEEILGCDFETVESFPDTLRDILLARYETLSEPTQRILRLIAAGGARVEHELLADVSDATPDAIDDAAREAVTARVLVVDDTAYSFRHALVREAIHDELLPGERMRFHTCYAQALEDRQGAPSVDSTAISYHWMAAHNVRAAFTASLTAMAQARASFANSTAARMGERAIELWEQVPDAEALADRTRVELLAETSYILRNAGESERAIALIDEAIGASSPSDADIYAKLLRDKASFLANIGHTGSIELLREALTVLEGRPRSVLRANVLGELAARLMLEALFDEAVATADSAYAEAEEVGSRPRMSVAANIRGISRLSLGEIDSGLADLALAGELAEGNESARLRYWVNESDAMSLLGRFEEAIRIAEAGAERARQRGVERTSGAMLMLNVIQPLFSLGESRRANEMLDRALELDPPIGFSAHLQRMKLQATVWSGDAALAEKLLRGWRAPLSLQLRIDAQSRLGLGAVAGEIALARGNVAEAWREVSVILAPEHRTFPAHDLPVLAIAARVLGCARASGVDLRAGDGSGAGTGTGAEGGLDEIERRLREALALVSGWPTAGAYVALFEAELGGPDRAGSDCALWAAAVQATVAPIAPAHLEPYARYRHAEALASAGDRSGARLRANEARVAAERIDMGLIVDRVDDLERRVGLVRIAGGRDSGGGATATAPDEIALPAVRSVEDDLTERERQVLTLIAQGLSNRQIAEQLFISAKTASVHVSNILRKTNTSSRTEAAYLARSFEAVRVVESRP
ncbi:helix-turn-helix transcriptional regulator [Herbiconiux ginsengi]|uniref:Regulatory protein, luxR family n=1 Tax=Herbiconiux ginsengi TaxID=381665 RepID=A0A1H3QD81_9MICO|nr:AAA family ATPase [Herbiconiux ginsengi]SDZ11356.1 regulatory protein, luxR family [Herbiconiux ginsengi]